MPNMDVDPPDRQTLCNRRSELNTTIESEEILITNFSEIINVPDTNQNIQMKEIVKKQIKEHQQVKDAALTELDSIFHAIPPTVFLAVILKCTLILPHQCKRNQ
ncbi:hypothetical protein TNCT_678631 [Trichonephila clavata]|uniref:Uncharacterized protein n=1 Tax=Trichonephila clavata TaxID=2740835 RepID=A0A8X6IQD3_TRICU|nr:hypothetical protein TNCT_678631 [Trichonephila clavata]